MRSRGRDVVGGTTQDGCLSLSRYRCRCRMPRGIGGRVVIMLMLLMLQGHRRRGDLLDRRLWSCVDPSLSWWGH